MVSCAFLGNFLESIQKTNKMFWGTQDESFTVNRILTMKQVQCLTSTLRARFQESPSTKTMVCGHPLHPLQNLKRIWVAVKELKLSYHNGYT